MTRRRQPLSVAAAIVTVVLLAAGCGGEEITEYQPEDRNEFLQACTLPGDDPILVTSVCGCVYDELVDDLAYENFRALSDELDSDEPPVDLDDALVAALGTCHADRVTSADDASATTSEIPRSTVVDNSN